MPGGSEREILEVVARLKEASEAAIARTLDITCGYADQLCKYLTRKGYLRSVGKRGYSLTFDGERLLKGDIWKLTVDKKMVEEIAREVAQEVAKEVTKKTGSGRARAPVELKRKEAKKIEIKTSFISPLEPGDLKLESNVEKVSRAEKAKFDIGSAVEALKKIKK